VNRVPIIRKNSGIATNRTISPRITPTSSGGTSVATLTLMLPDLSTPNSSPAAITPIGLFPARIVTVIPSNP
jgi:hypothetical protein